MLAADYDPSLDRREDEQKRIQNGAPVITTMKVDVDERKSSDDVEEVEDEEDGDEEDDLDDMFAIAMGDGDAGSDDTKKPKKRKKKNLVCIVPHSTKFLNSLKLQEKECYRTRTHHHHQPRFRFRSRRILHRYFR